ncbi:MULTISPECIES: HAD family hydrolase [Nocardioides]|uniref:HAD family hydrolase n=1 Tax=Nocardioides TaxID=1839 RepID=UPI00032DC98A|nr:MULTISPECIES: HAD family hydrolase [Nocardioides]EON25780.1 HAD family hydrolase [Nocardioides sp. CF8]
MTSPGRPRLVATDLDGTLLHTDGTVTERTRAVLTALDDLGVPVVFTTGRPIRWMESLWADVGGHGLAICSNGGIVYDVAKREVRTFWPVPRDIGLEIAGLLREAIPGTMLALEHTEGWVSEPTFPHHPDDKSERPTGELVDVYRDDVVKVLAVHRELAPEEFWRRVEELVGHLATTTWSSSFALVEISAAGVTKASTLATLAAELGIGPDEVVAFGDMPNDLPLLEWAGTSYAMANAHPDVLALAEHVAPPNDEDGVAAVLTGLFDLSLG